MLDNNALFIDNKEKKLKIYHSLLVKEFSRVYRYQCESDIKKFDVYVPIPLIQKISDFTPPELLVMIGCSPFSDSQDISINTPRKVNLDRDAWEFILEDVKGHSVKYSVKWNESPYNVYIPKTEFSGEPYPSAIILMVHLP